jgi:cellulose synthase/poly-beta-1,6-N-acetylglucosamine synthase-like glycosyltransferase
MSLATRTFAASAAAGAYVLAGYPLTLAVLPARPWRRSDDEPVVTVIVPAFQEREALRIKLEAMKDLDYPADRLEVLVAIDEDEELVQVVRAARPDAKVIWHPVREGKAAALTRALEAATGDVVIFTDANNVLLPASLRAAVRHFGDPGVWAVAGRRGEVDSPYDKYEDLIRRLESRSGVVAAMSGEFIAVRRERIPGWPSDIVNDDFWLLCHLVREGGRVIYEPEAASEEAALDTAAEVRRRSRMAAGRVMAVDELRDLPAGFVWRVASHKFGRLALPFLMLTTLASSLAASRRPVYLGLSAAQLAVYATGGLAAAGVSPPGRAGKVARGLGQVVVGNAAVGIGIVRGLRGRQTVRWDPVARA